MLKKDSLSRSYLIVERENQLTLPNHSDHLIIQPFNQPTISIDQVRDLIHWAYLKPFSKSPKIALIAQAQKMTDAAQNALLKILEEPPEQTVIILTVDDEKNLLPTVVSRCLRMEVGDWRLEVGNEGKAVKMERREFDESNLKPQISSQISTFNSQTSISQLFQLAEELSKKDREEILEILNAWTLNLRGSLLQNPKPATLDQLKKIKYTQKVLRGNVNKRLALENLFLSLR